MTIISMEEAAACGLELSSSRRKLPGTFDNHVHPCISDADPDQTPEEVCRAAKEAGLGHITITDHDSVLPEERRRVLAGTYQLDVISGCEFSAAATVNGIRKVIHIIGTWLPADAPEVRRVLEVNENQDREGYCKATLEKLRRIGIDPSGDGVDASYAMLLADYPNSVHIGRRAIGQLLVKTGYARSEEEASDRFLGAFGERLAYIPTEEFYHYAEIEEVMAACRLGLPTLCHLYYYQLDEAGNNALLGIFKELGGQALEVDYSRYDRRQKERLYRCYCKPYGLLPTAGSDRHSAGKAFCCGDPLLFKALRDRCRELHGTITAGEEEA